MNFKKKFLSISACITLLTISCAADQLTIFNHTSDKIVAGVYYVDSNRLGVSTGPAQRITPLFTIEANNQYNVKRPTYQYSINRELLFSTNKEDLQPVLDKKSWQSIGKTNIGSMRGSLFHITYKKHLLTGYDNASWTIKNLAATITGKLAQLKEQYCNHPYAGMTATVAYDNALCPEEIEFQQQRLPYIQDTLEKLLGVEMAQTEVPRIALCMSGGGMRAVISSYALLEAFHQLKLVNAIMYLASLSGSTWLVANWLASGLELEMYKDVLMDALTKVQFFGPATLASKLWPKYLFGQSSGIVDLYGVYLANTFFNYLYSDDARQALTLSHLQNRVKNGKWPFPLFTAGETTGAFNWCTFTPYQFSCDSLHYSMPIWSFGRRFKAGKSIDVAPESSLGFLMGIWGSALSGSVEEMLGIMGGSLDPRLFNALSTIVAETGLDDLRPAAIQIFNPLYHVPNAPFEKSKHIFFVDGGYECNIPLMPLFHPQRHADIIFILDVSENVYDNAPDLHKAEKQLKSMGIALPTIDYARALSQPISIFSNPRNPEAPTLICIMPIKNNRYDKQFDPKKEFKNRYPSMRFLYNREDVEKLAGLILFNILDNKKLIFNAIKEKMETNKKRADRA